MLRLEPMKSPIISLPHLRALNSQLLQMPAPANLNYFWGFGSLLGVCLAAQILRGVFLAIHYESRVRVAFESVDHIMRDVNWGWLLRILHANGASLFFICLYYHIGRGVYFASYRLGPTWPVGVIIWLAVQATAFLGYVLPWGQISFWGAIVITQLISTIPVVGERVVFWLWGGFAVRGPTLTRFFSIHYLLPFIVLAFVILHLIFLHEKGSGNPLGAPMQRDKAFFHPYFSVKDLLGFGLACGLLLLWALISPWDLGDPENFLSANPSVTPKHIQPEWYFLFAYCILRAIPSKLGGVVTMVSAILIFILIPLLPSPRFRGLQFYPISKGLFWVFVSIVFGLTYLGAQGAVSVWVPLSRGFSCLYFIFFFINPLLQYYWDLSLREEETNS